MFEWVKAHVLRLMRVPPAPEPPLGAPGSVRIFRAGFNQYRLRLLRWFVGQAGAIVGIGFSLVFLGAMEMAVENARRRAALPTPAASPSAAASPTPSMSPAPSPSAAQTRAERRRERDRRRDLALAAFLARMPTFVMPLIKFLEFAAIVFFGFQMMVTYAIVRLEFEQHWYIVTDRSLRIRTGILSLQESTMSFANIQQVEIRQGPVQRLLGLADVHVRSAGGGGDMAHAAEGHGGETSLHLGIFKGVDNAVEIRDLILERLRRFREAGLGDPEDSRSAAHHPADARLASPSSASVEAAVKELLGEARALRGALLTNS